MTKRFTVIRKKNPVSKEMGNYVQDRGTTILKLGFLEDCKDVCDILNELNDENDVLKQQLKTKYIVNKQYEELQKIKKEHRKLQLDFNDCCAIITNLKESKLDIEDENEQLKQGIIDCIFEGESLQIFAEEMGLIE